MSARRNPSSTDTGGTPAQQSARLRNIHLQITAQVLHRHIIQKQ